MDKKVYIVRGIPGSGKSSYIRKVANVQGVEQLHVVSADDFFMELVQEPHCKNRREYRFSVEKLPKAHSACMRGFLELLMQGVEAIAVDNTNIHRWEYENYEAAARLAGYKVEIIDIVATTLKEVEMCARRNTHGVPIITVLKMAMEFESDSRASIVSIGGI